MRVNVGAAIGLAKASVRAVCARGRQHRVSLLFSGLAVRRGSLRTRRAKEHHFAHEGSGRRVGGAANSRQLCGPGVVATEMGGPAGMLTPEQRAAWRRRIYWAWQCPGCFLCHRFSCSPGRSLDYRHGPCGGRRLHGALEETCEASSDCRRRWFGREVLCWARTWSPRRRNGESADFWMPTPRRSTASTCLSKS